MSIRGYRQDEVASALQKSIRRGLEDDALFWCTELDESGWGEYAWSRLFVITSEDVGLAEPQMPSVIRALYENVDTAIFDYFENVALDVDSTRAVIDDQAARDLQENATLRDHAGREAAKAEAALARVERDYLDGKLSIEKWERFEAKLTDELAGAKAQVEQYDRRREAIEAHVSMIDSEAEVAEELAALRRQIAGEVVGSDDLDRVRALLRRLFVGFELASPKARVGSGVLRGQPWVEARRPGQPAGL